MVGTHEWDGKSNSTLERKECQRESTAWEGNEIITLQGCSLLYLIIKLHSKCFDRIVSLHYL